MNTNNEAQAREEIEALLPWFAAGTLSRRDAERVEKALASDRQLARAYAAVREELAETIRLNETLGAPSARAMKALFEKIEAESPARRSAFSFNLAARVSEFIASLSPRTLAWSASAAAFAILLQAGIIAGVMLGEETGKQGGFRTVSIERSAPLAEGSYALVRFAPQASAAEITKFLQDRQATIVGGPAAGTGLYRVRVAVTGMPKEELARLVKQLQDNKIVGFAGVAD